MDILVQTMMQLQANLAQLQQDNRAVTENVVTTLHSLTQRVGGTPTVPVLPGTPVISPALRKLQEKDPEFPPYDGNPENFLPWIVTVEEEENTRKLEDQVAITFAVNALGSHARGAIGDGVTFADWEAFVTQLKKRFCADSFECNVAWRLLNMKVQGGNFQFYVSQFTMGMKLLKGSENIPEGMLRYCFIQGLEPDMQAEIVIRSY